MVQSWRELEDDRMRRVMQEAAKLPLRGLTRRDGDGLVEYATPWEGRPVNTPRYPTGLVNHTGVDCYRNSVWQALMSIPAFCNWLQDYHSSLPTSHGPRCPIPDCPGCRLYEVFNEIYGEYHNYPSYVQGSVLRSVDNAFAKPDPGRPTWKKEWITIDGVTIPVIDPSCERRGEEDASVYLGFIHEAVNKHSNRNALYVSCPISGVSVTEKLSCIAGHVRRSDDFSPPYLVLPPLGDGFHSLEDHLADWRDGKESLRICSHCDAPVRRYSVALTSPEAIFLLAPADFGEDLLMKRDVKFSEVLDMAPYGDFDSDSLLYRLSSIIFYGGSGKTGHYLTLVRGPTGEWSLLNDLKRSTFNTLEEALGDRGMSDHDRSSFTPHIFGYVRAKPSTGRSPRRNRYQPEVEDADDEESPEEEARRRKEEESASHAAEEQRKSEQERDLKRYIDEQTRRETIERLKRGTQEEAARRGNEESDRTSLSSGNFPTIISEEEVNRLSDDLHLRCRLDAAKHDQYWERSYEDYAYWLGEDIRVPEEHQRPLEEEQWHADQQAREKDQQKEEEERRRRQQNEEDHILQRDGLVITHTHQLTGADTNPARLPRRATTGFFQPANDVVRRSPYRGNTDLHRVLKPSRFVGRGNLR